MDQRKINKQNLKFLENITNNIIDWGFDNFPRKIFGTTSFGANGVVLLDFIGKINKNIPFYFIDTGYHFPETLEIKEYYRKQNFNVIEVSSTVNDSERLLREMGADVCCSINKVEPMKRILEGENGHLWITAISRNQSETRKNFSYLEPQSYNIVKLCPMLIWREDEIWQYIKEHNLIYNKLYDKGYKSIGCQPCTTKVKDGEDSRAGRWRGNDKQECGLHTEFRKS